MFDVLARTTVVVFDASPPLVSGEGGGGIEIVLVRLTSSNIDEPARKA